MRNFSKLQHYKNRPHNPWVKFYVKTLEDDELLSLPVPTRLLWSMLLLLASRYANAIPNDSERIANLSRMDPGDVHEGIQQLLKGGWLSETKTSRVASKSASKMLRQIREEKKELGLLRGVGRPERVHTVWQDTTTVVPLEAAPRRLGDISLPDGHAHDRGAA